MKRNPNPAAGRKSDREFYTRAFTETVLRSADGLEWVRISGTMVNVRPMSGGPR
jgi:hypothetical protein